MIVHRVIFIYSNCLPEARQFHIESNLWISDEFWIEMKMYQYICILIAIQYVFSSPSLNRRARASTAIAYELKILIAIEQKQSSNVNDSLTLIQYLQLQRATLFWNPTSTRFLQAILSGNHIISVRCNKCKKSFTSKNL